MRWPTGAPVTGGVYMYTWTRWWWSADTNKLLGDSQWYKITRASWIQSKLGSYRSFQGCIKHAKILVYNPCWWASDAPIDVLITLFNIFLYSVTYVSHTTHGTLSGINSCCQIKNWILKPLCLIQSLNSAVLCGSLLVEVHFPLLQQLATRNFSYN